MEDLADTCSEQSLFDEARRLVEASLEIRIQVHGLRHSTISRLQERLDHLIFQEQDDAISDTTVDGPETNDPGDPYLEPEHPENWRPWLGEIWCPKTPLSEIPVVESKALLLKFQRRYEEAKSLREIALAVRMKEQYIASPEIMEAIEALADLDEYILQERRNSSGYLAEACSLKDGYGSGNVAPVLRFWKLVLVSQELKETLGIGNLQTLMAGEELVNACHYKLEEQEFKAGVLRSQIEDAALRSVVHQKLVPSAQTFQSQKSLVQINSGLSIEQDTTTRKIILANKLVNLMKRQRGIARSDIIKATEALICLYQLQNNESAINKLISELSRDIFEVRKAFPWQIGLIHS
jgi:hypothetical protein